MKDGVCYNYFFACFIAVVLFISAFISCRTGSGVQGKKETDNDLKDSVVFDRDGNRYPIKKLPDNNWWILSNLQVSIKDSWFYNDSAEYGKQYGRLYSWTAAQAGCNSLGAGWRLPSKDEWQRMAENYGALGREETNLVKRAFPSLLAGGISGFNAVLGGGRNADSSYARGNAHGFYWTLSENDSVTAWFANFAKGSQALFIQAGGEKDRAFSVRCLKSSRDSIK